MNLSELNKKLDSLADPVRAAGAARFFKTGKGCYGEGDLFIGVPNPVLRQLSKEFKHLNLEDLLVLLSSPINEKRLLALFILILKFSKSGPEAREEIYNFYCQNMCYVNNWNLVDASAYYIVGAFILDKDKSVLLNWAKSENLWIRRISMVSTWIFIRKQHFETTLILAEMLLDDKEDLIHKAVGWMLREVGNKNESVLIAFLQKHKKAMPRTMFRYATEKIKII